MSTTTTTTTDEGAAPAVPTTGNNLLPPPRRSGDDATDIATLYEYMRDLYRALILEKNVTGSVTELIESTTTIQQTVNQHTTIINETSTVVETIDAAYVGEVNGLTPSPGLHAVTVGAEHIDFDRDLPDDAGEVVKVAAVLRKLPIDVENDFNADGTGATDSWQAIQDAVDSAADDGIAIVRIPGLYRITGGQLVVPTGVELEGDWFAAGERSGTNYAAQRSCLFVNGAVALRWGAGMRRCGVVRYGWTKPADTVRDLMDHVLAFDGVGIEARGDDTLGGQSEQRLSDVAIIGFNLGLDVFRSERARVDRMLIDCVNAVKLERVRDIARFSGVHAWSTTTNRYNSALTSYTVSALADNGGQLQVTTSSAHPFVTGDRVNLVLPSGTICRKRTPITVLSTTDFTCDDIAYSAAYSTTSGKVWPAVLYRDGIGFDVTDAERVTLNDCFSYGHATGFYAGLTQSWLNLIGPSYDNYNSAAVDTSIAFDIGSTARGICIIGGETNSAGVALRVNTSGALHHRIVGCELNVYTGGKVFDLIDGKAIIDSCETSAISTGTIGSGVEDVVFSATRMLNTTVTNSATAGTIFADGATKFANRLPTRSEIGVAYVGAPGTNIAMVLNQAGADTNQGAQIQWGSSTLAYERVTQAGTYQLLNQAYTTVMIQATQAGVVTVPTLSVSGNGTITGNLTVTGLSVLTDAVTIGSATAEQAAGSALILRGSQSGNPNAGAQITQLNPDAPSDPVYTRVGTSGAWFVLNASGSIMLSATQAGTVTIPTLSVSGNAVLSGTLGVTGATTMTAALTIGSATAELSAGSALILRGSQTGNPNAGAQIVQTNPDAPSLPVYTRVNVGGAWQVLQAGGTALLSATQAGVVTVPSLAVTVDADVTGSLEVGGTTTLTGAVTIGSTTPDVGPATPLKVRGNVSGDTARGGEIEQFNPSGGYSIYTRVESTGVYRWLGDSYTTLGFFTQAGDFVPGTGAELSAATAGFLHLPAADGHPSGAAVTHTNRTPITFNTVTRRIEAFQGGSWRDDIATDTSTIMRLRRAARAAIDRNPLMAGTASGVTVTMPGSADAGLTNIVYTGLNSGAVTPLPQRFVFRGGTRTESASGYWSVFPAASAYPANGNLVGQVAGEDYWSAWTWEAAFFTDAPLLEISVVPANNKDYRVLVDGQYATAGQIAPPSYAGGQRIRIDFSSVRKARLIQVKARGEGGIQKVAMDALSNVWAPPLDEQLRVVITGDSITEGQGTSSPSDPDAAFAPQLAHLMGWQDMWQVGVGSTGYVADGSGTRSPIIDQIPYWPADIDAIVCAAGYNDQGSGVSASDTATAALAAWQAMRAAYPLAVIFVVAPWIGRRTAATMAAHEAALLAEFTAWADRDSFFIPVSADATPWTSGTGYVGATTGGGNSDIYVASDGLHFSDAGHAYHAQRIASGIRTALRIG